MYLHTAEPKTAALFVGRLRETEKIAIRGASPDRLEHLRQTDFAYDMLTPEVMAEAKAMLDANFKAAHATTGFGETWKI